MRYSFNPTLKLKGKDRAFETERPSSASIAPLLTCQTAPVAHFRDVREVNIHGGLFILSSGLSAIYPGPRHSCIPEGKPGASKENYQIYHNEFMIKRQGIPLWVPGPNWTLPIEYRRVGISIGDVGFVYQDAGFEFLFNIFVPADHPINAGRVPAGFVPFHLSEVRDDIQETIVYGPNSYLASSSIRTSNTGSGFIFESSAKEGAILVLPDGAISKDLRLTINTSIRKYLADNAKHWYSYAAGKREQTVDDGDICLVVGCDKVSSWGIATFDNHDEKLVRVEFKHATGKDGARTSMWDFQGSGTVRIGPHEVEVRDLIHENDGSPLQNQCVFVRTQRFTHNGKMWHESPADRPALLPKFPQRTMGDEDFSGSEWSLTGGDSSDACSTPGEGPILASKMAVGYPRSHMSTMAEVSSIASTGSNWSLVPSNYDYFGSTYENHGPANVRERSSSLLPPVENRHYLLPMEEEVNDGSSPPVNSDVTMLSVLGLEEPRTLEYASKPKVYSASVSKSDPPASSNGLASPTETQDHLKAQQNLSGVQSGYTAPHALLLLSIDDGGIRGLSCLIILKEILYRIQVRDGLIELPRPCDVFDLAGGTGTGGLIVIMLFRLGMTIEATIKAYVKLARYVFSETKKFSLSSQRATFRASLLEKATQHIIKQHMKIDECEAKRVRMFDASASSPKAFVCAMAAQHIGDPVRFRTWKPTRNPTYNCTVIEAVRATMAAPTFFKSIKMGNKSLEQTYVGGNLGCNNPIECVLLEAAEAFPGQDIACIVSLGTGAENVIGCSKSGNNLSQVLENMTRDRCESVAESFARRFADKPDIYFRLNVEQGMQALSWTESRTIESVIAHTEMYLRKHAVSLQVDRIVQKLKKRGR